MGEAPDIKTTGPTTVESGISGPGGRDSGLAGTGSTMPFNRGFFQAKKIVSHGANNQELHDTFVTSDPSPQPRFRLKGKAVRLRRNEKVESWHNILYLGKVPVFYFPYVIYDLRYNWPWMRVSGGNDSDWGAYVMTSWGMDLDPEDSRYFRPEKLYLDIDWRAERGFAGGLSLKYELGRRASYGKVSGYYLKETEIGDGDDVERAREDTEYGDLYANDERWKFEWQHYQDLAGEWDLRAELNQYSDRDFLKEYFPDEYNEDKEPESVIDLRKLNDKYVFEVIAKAQVNDFFSQAEYLPEFRLSFPAHRIGKTGFFVRNDTRAGFINKRYDEKVNKEDLRGQDLRTDGKNDYGNFFRAHTDTRVYHPINLGGRMTLTPYIGAMAAHYGDLYDDSRGHTQAAGLYGFDLTGRYYGKYSWGRHVIEPTISFVANEDPILDPDDLYPVDEVDLYNELHYLKFSLHQKWQVKRMVESYRAKHPSQRYLDEAEVTTSEQIVDLLDLDISTRYIPVDGEAGEVNAGANWEQIDIDFVYRPTNRLTLYGNVDYDPEENYFTNATLGMDWMYRDLFRVNLSHYHRRGDTRLNPHLDKSNETTLALRWIASDKYTLEYAMTREWAGSTENIDSGLAKQRISVIRNAKVFELQFSYTQDRRRDDHSFFVTLSPIGIKPLDRSSSASGPTMQEPEGRYQPSMVEEVGLP
jgi:hypothetical protein